MLEYFWKTNKTTKHFLTKLTQKHSKITFPRIFCNSRTAVCVLPMSESGEKLISAAYHALKLSVFASILSKNVLCCFCWFFKNILVLRRDFECLNNRVFDPLRSGFALAPATQKHNRSELQTAGSQKSECCFLCSRQQVTP